MRASDNQRTPNVHTCQAEAQESAGMLAAVKRNADLKEESCKVVPLPDILKGPCHVAWKRLEEFPFNDEHADVTA